MRHTIHNYFDMKRTTRNALLSGAAGIFLLGTISFHLLETKVMHAFEQSIRDDVAEMSEQNAKIVHNELLSRQSVLQTLADDISRGNAISREEILRRMESYAKYYQFYTMGVIDASGLCETIEGEQLDVSDMEYYKEGFKGASMITKSYPSVSDEEQMLNIITAPVYGPEGTVRFVLSATYEASHFYDLLNVSSFHGAGNSMVVDSEENSVITLSDGEVNRLDDLLEEMQKNAGANQALLTEKEFLTFHYQGKEYLAHLADIGIENWHLLTYVDKESAFARVDQLERDILWIIGGLGMLLSMIILCSLLLYRHYHKKINTIVFVDDLLQKKNFNYFRMYFQTLPAEEQNQYCFIVFDIDRFKALNLLYGTKRGDWLLRYIDRIMAEEIKDILLYRSHGDHFVAALRTDDETVVESKLSAVLSRIDKDVKKGSCVPFSLSMGICMFCEGKDLHTVLVNASIAKYTVKNHAGKKYAFFDKQMKEQSLQRIQMESMCDAALEKHEFIVYYQPKFDMRNNVMIGSEALVRWPHPVQGFISPQDFIPCMEECGKIIDLDEQVLEIVCRDLQKMMHSSLEILPVSINLSRLHLHDQRIIQKLRQLIKEYRIDPSKLAFEITESAFYDEIKPMKSLVEQLHAIGCRVDMDDYGTGISSLQSLANIDFDVIKLDRSFVSGIGNQKMESVIQATIDLARRLRLQLVAEGVENEQQRTFLLENGCCFAQGYYYSRALCADEYMQKIRSQRNVSGEKP